MKWCVELSFYLLWCIVFHVRAMWSVVLLWSVELTSLKAITTELINGFLECFGLWRCCSTH